jgi:hypothetical protein
MFVTIKFVTNVFVKPVTTTYNLQRLSAALHELSARINAVDVAESLPFDPYGSLSRALGSGI